MLIPLDAPDGALEFHRQFRSRVLGNERDLVVWLPPGMDGRKRHPVIYFQDGQNLFEPGTAFNGQDWHAGRTAAELVRAGEIEPPILVGVYNTGAARIDEYAPTPGKISADGESYSRGRARQYVQFVTGEVKPFIDGHYRTLTGPAHTSIAGSSMGGLAAFYAVLWQPRIFGAAGVLSPSTWWDDAATIHFVEDLRKKPPVRLWLDTGTAEPGWENTRRLHDTLVEHGWRDGQDLHYLEVEGAEHNEAAWAARTGPLLRWLVPGKGRV
jgi:predicted alpha/beta superfamily hydrolase